MPDEEIISGGGAQRLSSYQDVDLRRPLRSNSGRRHYCDSKHRAYERSSISNFVGDQHCQDPHVVNIVNDVASIGYEFRKVVKVCRRLLRSHGRVSKREVIECLLSERVHQRRSYESRVIRPSSRFEYLDRQTLVDHRRAPLSRELRRRRDPSYARGYDPRFPERSRDYALETMSPRSDRDQTPGYYASEYRPLSQYIPTKERIQRHNR